jgi:hypothetical protein
MSKLFRLNFVYNPSDVTMEWIVSTPDAAPPNLQDPTQIPTLNYTTMGVQFGFNLLFDRVGDRHPEVLKWGGVNADIRILNSILTSGGMPGQHTFAAPAKVIATIGRSYDGANLGANDVLNHPPKQYPLGAAGWITSASVDYQRFDVDMTPTRAVVSISMLTLTWNPDSHATAFDSSFAQTGTRQTGQFNGVPIPGGKLI